MKANVPYLAVRGTATTVLIGEGPFRRELIHNTIRACDLVGDSRGCVRLNLRMSPWCQQNRRARLAIDFSTDWACILHASDVLGVCVMITSALLQLEPNLSARKMSSEKGSFPKFRKSRKGRTQQ